MLNFIVFKVFMRKDLVVICLNINVYLNLDFFFIELNDKYMIVIFRVIFYSGFSF